MWNDYIQQKPGVLGGKPVIKGTRIAADLILEKFGAGETVEDLMAAYPHITKDQLLACISYGAAVIRNETIIEI